MVYSYIIINITFYIYFYECDCWLKEDYDMDSFRFTKPSNTQQVSSESEEVKEVKKTIDKIVQKKERKEISNNVFKSIGGTIKDTLKKLKRKKRVKY